MSVALAFPTKAGNYYPIHGYPPRPNSVGLGFEPALQWGGFGYGYDRVRVQGKLASTLLIFM